MALFSLALAKGLAALVADPDFSAWLEKRRPAGRLGRVGACGFWAVSSFANGHILYVDGGIAASI
jgi:gluconate 5-dehydrogenase